MPVNGRQLKVARLALGLKLQDLAKVAKVSPTSVSKIENGADALASTLQRIQSALEARGAVFQEDEDHYWVGWTK